MAFSNQQQEWIDQFVIWSESRKDIRAAMVFGSQAENTNNQADEWADIDIAFFTSKARLYTKDNAWMHDIYPVWAGIVDRNETWGGLAAASGFSVYKDGLIVDFVILPKIRVQWIKLCIQLLNLRPSVWQRRHNPVIEICSELAGFFRRGVSALVDKDGFTERLEQVTRAIPQYSPLPPSAEEFQQNVDDFWIDPPRVVANLRRGKLAGAMRCTRPMKKQLYNMAEWHARAKRDWDDGIEYRLKSVERWADPYVLNTLPQIYARYDDKEMWNALLEMMKLYRRLATETADLLGYDCDLDTTLNVSEWILKCYRER